MTAPRRSRGQMLDLHARALIALHEIYKSSDVISYNFIVMILENLAAKRPLAETKISRNLTAEQEAWLRRQLEGLGK